MIHHAKAVRRGCTSSFLVGDLPFGTYEKSPDQALDSAIRYMREARVECVKLEGGLEVVGQVEKLARFGIPVMAHVGLTPQRQAGFSGYRVQGRTLEKV